MKYFLVYAGTTGQRGFRHRRRDFCRDQIDIEQCFIDGTFIECRKMGVLELEKLSGAKDSKLMAMADRTGLERSIEDRAYDSGPLNERPAEQSSEMIASHKRNRTKSRMIVHSI